MARRPSALSTQQSTYVDGRLVGKSKNKAAKDAGYLQPQCPEKSALVKFEIAQAREKLTDLTTIKRLDVIDGIMDAIACARMQGDAGNMIKGWSEVAKILGHYAPEVKTVNISMNQQRLRSKYEAMSTEELLRLMETPATREVIDVESKTAH